MAGSREQGFVTVKPLWVGLGLVACLAAGATMKKCLTCSPGTGPSAAPRAEIRGAPIDSPVVAPPAPPAPSAGTEPAAPAPPPAPPPPPDSPPAEGGPVTVSFELLSSFTYEFPAIGAAEHKDQIPSTIKALDGKSVAIQGFMVPIKGEGDYVTEFILVRYQFGCCFGVVPKMNEWAHVKMKEGAKATYVVHIPVVVTGTLAVGELIEDGVVMSIYRLDGDEASEPPTFR